MMKMQEWKYRHDSAGVDNAGVETSARFCRGGKCRSGKIGTILQWWKMREWKHRHGPAGVENAGVEVIELQQQDNLSTNFKCRLIRDNRRNTHQIQYKTYFKISRHIGTLNVTSVICHSGLNAWDDVIAYWDPHRNSKPTVVVLVQSDFVDPSLQLSHSDYRPDHVIL